MGKYEPLRKHLVACRDKLKVRMTFAEVAAVLGTSLPNSAFKHRGWWANPVDATHRPHAAAWLDAGFEVESVKQDADNGWVEFVRK